ncbi:MAG: hypothetical protein ABFQ53_00540 [Patescibacteria group bacterium]
MIVKDLKKEKYSSRDVSTKKDKEVPKKELDEEFKEVLEGFLDTEPISNKKLKKMK